MKAFVKTLFGDPETVGVVVVVMATEVALIAGGQMDWMAFAVPCLVLAGTAWLARR